MRFFSKGAKKKILIASHAEEEIPLLESRLKARGYDIETASSSVEVVHKVNRSHFDLILLDSKMEEVRHTDLAALLRRRSFLRSIPIVMLTDPGDIASLVSSVEKGFDDFLTRPIDTLTLQLRVALNIQRAEERLETNPLTQLPGNVAIEKTVKHLIETRALFSVIYTDLNNFKALNDSFGYETGDGVLRQTAYILETHAKRYEGRIASFVGHLGGDDFVLIVCPSVSEKIARAVIRDFDKIVPTYYSPEARQAGFVEVKNRRGELEQFPLISIAIAEVSNEFAPIMSPGEAAQRLVEVKKFLKSQTGSSYLKDRRGRPFASLDEAVKILSPVERESSEPLGQMLLKKGLITDTQLQEALEKHFETGERLGEILISLGWVKPDEIGRILSQKLGIPYTSLSQYRPSVAVLETLDERFMRTNLVIPLEVSGDKLLYLGMVDPHNQKIVREVEETTHLAVKPCLILEEELGDFFKRLTVAD